MKGASPPPTARWHVCTCSLAQSPGASQNQRIPSGQGRRGEKTEMGSGRRPSKRINLGGRKGPRGRHTPPRWRAAFVLHSHLPPLRPRGGGGAPRVGRGGRGGGEDLPPLEVGLVTGARLRGSPARRLWGAGRRTWLGRKGGGVPPLHTTRGCAPGARDGRVRFAARECASCTEVGKSLDTQIHTRDLTIKEPLLHGLVLPTGAAAAGCGGGRREMRKEEGGGARAK